MIASGITLGESEDERATLVADALSGPHWDLETASAVAAGAGPSVGGWDVLDGILRLRLPGTEEIEGIASDLKQTAARISALEGSEAGRSRRSIDLLEAALPEHADHGDQPCPVCGTGTLDGEWRRRAETQVDELRRSAAAYEEAVAGLADATRRARDVIAPVPAELAESAEGLEAEPCRRAWVRWAEAPEDPSELVAHLRSAYPPLAGDLDQLQKQAATQKAEREDAWRPLAVRAASVVEKARHALVQNEQAKTLKQSEDALALVTAEVRSRRFQPIADQAISLWASLRLQSNVELTGVELAGTRTRRRVDLSVKVDGTDGAALGVVSQGRSTVWHCRSSSPG